MAPLIDLERIDGPDDRRPGATVVESPGPRGSRRTLLAIALVVAIVVAGLVLLSGGDDNGDDQADAPTTTAQSSETTRPRRRVTEPPPVSTAFDVVIPEELRARMAGQSLYIVARRTITRVEMDTGHVTQVPDLLARSDTPTDVAVLGGKLVVTQPARTTALPLDLSDDGDSVSGSLEAIWGSGRLFEVDYASDGPLFPVTEFDVSAQVVNEWQVPVNAYVGGVVGDRLVVHSSGRNYFLGPHGEIDPIGSGDLMFVSELAIVTRQCDDVLVCSFIIQDSRTGEVRGVTTAAQQLSGTQFGPIIAPDASAAVVTDEFGTSWLTDLLGNRAEAVLDPMTRAAWSSDGGVLIARSGEGEHDLVAFLSADDYTEVGIDLSSAGSRTDVVLLAIG